jgi:uncharacterized protein
MTPDTPALTWALNLLLLQGLMGGFDTLYHHELSVKLPQRSAARLELVIHAIRAILYAILFLGIAQFEPHGSWTIGLVMLVGIEVLLTLWDFVVEDRSRRLPATERIVHTLLAINGGAVFALYGWQLAGWSTRPTDLLAIDLGWRGTLLSLLGIGVAISGLRDGYAALRLHRVPPPANPFTGLAHQRLLVTGGTGFIGEPLVQRLLEAGHDVTVLTRDPIKAAFLFGGGARCVGSLDRLAAEDTFDGVINLAGAPVVGPRWTHRRQAKLLASRIDSTRSLVAWVDRAKSKPSTWIQASAIGFYGIRDPSENLDEESSAGNGFMVQLCSRWEAAAKAVNAPAQRQVVLRLGLVFGPGGALTPLVMPFRLGFGGRLGDGKQAMSWIHREDVIALIALALEDKTMRGVYNAVAPDPITQEEFAMTVGHVLQRPVSLHIPAGPISWLAGEMAQLFVDGQRVVPTRLLKAGFSFRFPTLANALNDLIR